MHRNTQLVTILPNQALEANPAIYMNEDWKLLNVIVDA
jgi:hypothetical protein